MDCQRNGRLGTLPPTRSSRPLQQGCMVLVFNLVIAEVWHEGRGTQATGKSTNL